MLVKLKLPNTLMFPQKKLFNQGDKSYLIRTFALIKPEIYKSIGKILTFLENSGLQITK